MTKIDGLLTIDLLDMTEEELRAQGHPVFTADQLIRLYDEYLDGWVFGSRMHGKDREKPFTPGRLADSNPPLYCNIERLVLNDRVTTRPAAQIGGPWVRALSAS